MCTGSLIKPLFEGASSQAYAPDAEQNVLNRLVVYARSKYLTISTAKSEVVHFNSECSAVLRCPLSC